MTRRIRWSALLLCVGFVFVLLLSCVYIAAEAGHPCEGEGCAICRLMALHTRTLRFSGLALVGSAELPEAQRDAFRLGETERAWLSFAVTPVRLKVRLND